LNQDIQWISVSSIIEPRSNFFAVNGMNPIELGCNEFGFVALDMPNIVPFDIQSLQFMDFFDSFLNIVLSEAALSSACNI